MGKGKMVFIIIATALVLALIVLMVVGKRDWTKHTKQMRARLDAAQIPVQPTVVDFSELVTLPEPVQRYFRAVLKDGQPMIAGASLKHRGTFNLGEGKDRWCRFTSDQKVVTKRPGFDWDANISLFPGLYVCVRDAFIDGEGLLQASMFGKISLANMKGGKLLGEGELMRFLAEAAWYPTALLPSQGVQWQPIDDTSASAVFSDGTYTVTMVFTFNRQNLITSIGAASRSRMVSGQNVPTPWEGRFGNYQTHGGMQIPTEGEAVWLLPGGDKPYWRGTLTEVTHIFSK